MYVMGTRGIGQAKGVQNSYNKYKTFMRGTRGMRQVSGVQDRYKVGTMSMYRAQGV